MISPTLIAAFTNAARALASGAKDSGYTGNGLRKLDFFVREGGRQTIFTAIEQNPNKLSVPGKLAREGHKIVQIRDDQKQALLGNVDVNENRWNSYENIPNPVDISEIEESLGSLAVRDPKEVAVTAARTATPIDFTPNEGQRGSSSDPFKRVA